MHFDLVDMKLFVHIAESNSLTLAAEQSYMSLPAASMRIKSVEQRLGTKLLYRHGRGITITPAGQAFFHYSLVTMQNIERLLGEMQDYANGVKGCVRIFADAGSIGFLPTALRTFLSTNPCLSIDLRERSSHDITHAVSDGSADMGIVAGNACTGDLQIVPFKQGRLVLATAAHHVLADRKTIGFNETLEFDYIGLLDESAIQASINHAAKEIHSALKVRIEVGNFESLCRMIEANVGIGILPRSVARRHEKNMALRIVDLQDDWAVWNLQICVRSMALLPSFARELIDVLVDNAATD